jgi:hypothetical protein
VTEFDVPGARRVESYCRPCRRGRNVAHYHRAQRERRKTPPDEATCVRCGATKPASEFYEDQRYREGLYTECKECHSV